MVVHVTPTQPTNLQSAGIIRLLEPPKLKPRYNLHGDSDPDPDPDWLRLHRGKLDSNPDSDHILSHVDCDPDSNPDSGTWCSCKRAP